MSGFAYLPSLLAQVGEFIRLYGWLALPPYISFMTIWSMRPGVQTRWTIAWLVLDFTWLCSRFASVYCTNLDAWSTDAVFDVLAGSVFFDLACRYPGRARQAFALLVALEAVELLVHVGYAVHLICHGYSKFSEKLWYWSCFVLAWGQALIIAMWDRSNAAGNHRRDRDRFSGRVVRMRVASCVSARAGGQQ